MRRPLSTLPLILAIAPWCAAQERSPAIAIPTEPQSAAAFERERVSRSLNLVYQDSHTVYWLGSDKGVYRSDGRTTTLYTVDDGLCTPDVRWIQDDRSGNLFFESGKCISKFDGKTFTTLEVIEPVVPEDGWKLSPNDVWFRGKWSENGPYRYDGSKLYHVTFPVHPLASTAQHTNPSYSLYAVYSIYRDGRGAIWFGTSNLGAGRFDGSSLKWLADEGLAELDDGPAAGVRSIVEDEDEDGSFLFSNSMYRYTVLPEQNGERNDDLLSYSKSLGINAADAYPQTLTSYLSSARDPDGDLWPVTYDDGAWKHDGRALTQYPVQAGDRAVTLSSVYVDRQGLVRVATDNAGLFRLNGTGFEPFILPSG